MGLQLCLTLTQRLNASLSLPSNTLTIVPFHTRLMWGVLPKAICLSAFDNVTKHPFNHARPKLFFISYYIKERPDGEQWSKFHLMTLKQPGALHTFISERWLEFQQIDSSKENNFHLFQDPTCSYNGSEMRAAEARWFALWVEWQHQKLHTHCFPGCQTGLRKYTWA